MLCLAALLVLVLVHSSIDELGQVVDACLLIVVVLVGLLVVARPPTRGLLVAVVEARGPPSLASSPAALPTAARRSPLRL
jgi:hypothetical protein